MICGIATPSACEKSRSVTPDSTVTGPVGATTSRGVPRAAVGRPVARPLALALAGTAAALIDDDATPALGAAAARA